MKTLKEIGLIPIKCKVKETQDDLKELHYAVNDVLFTLGGTYITTGMQKRLLMLLKDKAEGIKNIEPKSKAIREKREEILERLRQYYRVLRDYESNNDETQQSKVLKYRLFVTLRAKENFNQDEALKVLGYNKIIVSTCTVKNEKLNEAQSELINRLVQPYKI